MFASSESKLKSVMESTKSAMEDVGLQWNPKKRVVAYVHIHTHDALGLRVDKSICISNLEEGDQYKFSCVLESARGKDGFGLRS